MNKEYIEVNDKIIITNDEGLKRPVNYRDNIEDILICEDIIEEIQKTLPNIKKQLDGLEKSKNFINIRPIGIMVCSILVTILSFVILGIDGLKGTIAIKYIGEIEIYKVFGILGTLLLGTGAGISKLFYKWDIQELENTRNGLNSQLELLQKTLVEEKKKMNELIKDRKVEHQGKNNYKPKKVNKKLLERLKILLKFYYKCGYNKNKYQEYLDEGVLEKKLGSSYSKSEIELVKEHLSGEGPKLRKVI